MTRAHVDEIDREYLTLLAEQAQPKPPTWDLPACGRRRELDAAARRLIDAITEHDLVAYGDPYPEDHPPCAVNPLPSSSPSPASSTPWSSWPGADWA